MSAKRSAGPLSGSSDEEEEDRERAHHQTIRDANADVAAGRQLDGERGVPEEQKEQDCINSSTPSACVAAGQPVFSEQAETPYLSRTIRRPKQKKQKSALGGIDAEGPPKPRPTPPKTAKQKRDCLPMRMRALPQSFWQQPNHPHNISPGALCHRVLPPLCCKDGGQEDDIDTLRPVSPVNDKDGRDRDKARPRAERNLNVGNTDLLYKLFEHVEDKKTANVGSGLLTPVHPSRRGRPKRTVSSSKPLLRGDDPYLVETVTAKLFPHLSIDAGRTTSSSTAAVGVPNISVQLITIHEGDKCVTLPSLCIEQNYSQMLTELASHI